MIEWLSIKNNRPDNGETVLVYASRVDCKRAGIVYRARYIGGLFVPINGKTFPKYQITHYQKLNERR